MEMPVHKTPVIRRSGLSFLIESTINNIARTAQIIPPSASGILAMVLKAVQTPDVTASPTLSPVSLCLMFINTAPMALKHMLTTASMPDLDDSGFLSEGLVGVV